MVNFRIKKKKSESKGKKMVNSVAEEAAEEIVGAVLIAGIKGILRLFKHLLNALQ